MGQKRFKIFFHQHFFHQPELPLRTGFWKKLKNKIFYLGKIVVYGIFGLCYLIGEWVIRAVINIYKSIKNEILNTFSTGKKRAHLAFSREFLVNNGSLVIGAVSLCLFLAGFRIFADGLVLKENVLELFGRGQSQLNDAKKLLSEQNPQEALIKFSGAFKSFESAKQQINEADNELKVLISILPEGADGKKILNASTLLSKSGGNMLNFYTRLKDLKITAEGISSEKENKSALLDALGFLSSAKNDLTESGQLLNEVNISSVPKNQQAEFLQIRNLLEKVTLSLENFSEMCDLFASVLLKSSNILLVMENNNELRPGGGFIGSFASIKQSAGKIASLRLGSIYDLDGQLQEKIMPPLPILAVNDRWFLRDSNWFADFSVSAQKISEFYEKEGGETPDLVIALTPSLVADLLKITGPVEMKKYSVVLNAENFVEITQVLTTTNDSTPENQPKQFLADLMPVLMQKLGELKLENLNDFLEIIFKNLNEKQVLAYSRLSEVQNQISKFNWSGEVKNSDRDYLEVVSSNLGGTKSDLFVDQELNLTTKIDEFGNVKNELLLTFFNKLPELEHTYNTRFIRVLLPKGSKFISATGFDYKNLEPLNPQGYKADAQAYTWDKNLVKDIITGTLIGEEADKTFFGNWLTLKGGQSRTVKLSYQLPFTLANLDHYNLLLQKQPGANNFNVTYNLELNHDKVLWKSFTNDVDQNGNITLKESLNEDKFWGLVISR